MVACSTVEATAWKDGIAGRIAVESKRHNDELKFGALTHSPLTAEMQASGRAYGKKAVFIAKPPVHRSNTIGQKAELNQVMITNTAALKGPQDEAQSQTMPRSQSVATASRIPVLSPRRSERVRLEQLLSDVWTKSAIPYPGLTPKRSEYNIRESANNVMRKLSMASIASNFSRRSASHVGSGSSSGRESKLTKQRPRARQTSSFGKGMNEKPKVTFHTTPEAFLPADFELPNLTNKVERLGTLKAFTMSSERSRSPFGLPETTVAGLRRSRSVLGRLTPVSRLLDTNDMVGRSTDFGNMQPSSDVIHATPQAPSGLDLNGTSGRRARAMSKLTKIWA